ncbi:MAG TPA: polysaccharide biosynthesis C-terminal domain-containing protein, partial [Thermoanaerobaculia bacterium]|nr:polysaccharide biosynthesis C-terminal domain-containing protein [Thermoanaerobaculia bacterium]
LQRPWIPTMIAAGNLTVTALAALALYHLGVGGIVASTAIATTVSVIAQGAILHRLLGGLELKGLLAVSLRICLAAAALAAVSYGIWDLLDGVLGRGLVGQILSLGCGLAVGGVVYLIFARLLRIAELEQIMRLLRRR